MCSRSLSLRRSEERANNGLLLMEALTVGTPTISCCAYNIMQLSPFPTSTGSTARTSVASYSSSIATLWGSFIWHHTWAEPGTPVVGSAGVLESKDAGVLPGESFLGIPRGGAPAFETPILGKALPGRHVHGCVHLQTLQVTHTAGLLTLLSCSAMRLDPYTSRMSWTYG